MNHSRLIGLTLLGLLLATTGRTGGLGKLSRGSARRSGTGFGPRADC